MTADIQIENCQENLCLDLEHDGGYSATFLNEHKDVAEEISRVVLVFNSGQDFQGIEGMEAYCVSVDEAYPWNLSPGQRKTYELLLPLQQGSLYAMTTVRKLADAMGLDIPWAAYKRLENLQSLGVIRGITF